MSEKISVELGDVQRTLMLPLWGRAQESLKAHPALSDPTAVEIMEKVDFDFATISKNINPLSQAAWIRRSIFTDQVIRDFLVRYPDGLVVNIGCGMDTTFERVDNGRLHWIDLDLTDVIQLRRQFIAESERRQFISSSFLETEWLEALKVQDNILFIAAGVFYYFEEAQVKNFLIQLADRFPAGEIFFDVSSPFGIRVANKKVIESAGLDQRSYLKWGLENVSMFPTWDERLEIVKTRYYFRGNKGSLPLNIWLIGLFSDSKDVQYMVHLRIKG